MSETKTNVEHAQVDDLDNLLGMPGAESIVTPADEETAPAAPKFFQKADVDMSVLDVNSTPTTTEETTTPVAEEGGTVEATTPETTSFDDITKEIDPVEDLEEEAATSKGGRPALDKAGMNQLTQKLIEKNLILPFDEDKSMDEYTMDDFVELFEANFSQREQAIKEQTPAEFFNSLPPELQKAAAYVHEGGTDLKGLFKHLASAEELKELDPSTERGSEAIVREYLRATNYGSDEDIQEEIDSWKDLDKLEEKASKFKPKLDAMNEQIVQRKIAEQESKRKQQEEASYAYMENVYKTLEDGSLNGITMNNKIQNMLYAGLVQPNYPSISGKSTNLFGHLIEKYQFVEPRHDLIAEALWLLADPEGYKSEVSKLAVNEQVTDTVRKLKTEQQASKGGTTSEEPTTTRKTRGIARPSKNFFTR